MPYADPEMNRSCVAEYRRAHKAEIAAYNKKWRTENADKVRRYASKSGPKARAKRRFSIDARRHDLVNAARDRARRKNTPFDIDVSRIEWPTHCPVLGVELDYFATGFRRPNSASLDRMVPTIGYVEGNVRVLSYRANAIKSDATLAELRAVVAYMSGAV